MVSNITLPIRHAQWYLDCVVYFSSMVTFIISFLCYVRNGYWSIFLLEEPRVLLGRCVEGKRQVNWGHCSCFPFCTVVWFPVEVPRRGDPREVWQLGACGVRGAPQLRYRRLGVAFFCILRADVFPSCGAVAPLLLCCLVNSSLQNSTSLCQSR